jgi:hypothetical protein
LVDNNGKIHAWTAVYSSGLDEEDECLGGTTYYPGAVDWLFYWNESMELPMVIQGLQPDIDGDGEIRVAQVSYNDNGTVYGLPVIHAPVSTVDLDGNLYVTYFAPVEGVDDGAGNYFYPTQSGDETGRSYTDLYTIISTDGGATWSKPLFLAEIADAGAVDETRGTGFEEECFPSAVKRMRADNIYHLIWQVDFETSLNLRSHHGVVENFITYHGFTKDELLNAAAAVGLTDAYSLANYDELGLVNEDFCGDFPVLSVKKQTEEAKNNVSSIYPNPTTGLVNISLKLENSSNVAITVRNIVGQEMLVTPSVNLNRGYNTVSIDLTNLPNGIYTYSVVSDEGVSSGRVVKE